MLGVFSVYNLLSSGQGQWSAVVRHNTASYTRPVSSHAANVWTDAVGAFSAEY